MKSFSFFLSLGVWLFTAAPVLGETYGMLERGITNGSRAPRAVPLTPEEQLAIGWLTMSTGPTQAFCTGTLITSYVVMTAKHCVTTLTATDIRFGLGVQPSNSAAVFNVIRIDKHPNYDAALLILEQDAVATLKNMSKGADVEESEVTPIAYNRVNLTGKHNDALLDRPVEIAGYGDTFSNETGRFFATVVYSGIPATSSEFIQIQGNGVAGACSGDSGGPLMALTERGRPVILGVLYGGDETCMGRDFMTRLDIIQEWIDRGIEATWSVNPVGSPCSDLDFGGRCIGNVAEYCDENFTVQRLDCTEKNSVCVFKNEDEGYYCHRPERCLTGGSCTNPLEGFVPVGPIAVGFKGACSQTAGSSTFIWTILLIALGWFRKSSL